MSLSWGPMSSNAPDRIDSFPKYLDLPLSLQDLMDAVVTAAEASADNLIRSEGRQLWLEESLDLLLPFLLPEGGYSCDTVKGIPQGFIEFLEPICQKGGRTCSWIYELNHIFKFLLFICFIFPLALTGLCCLTSLPHSQGEWTAHFTKFTHTDGDLYLVKRTDSTYFNSLTDQLTCFIWTSFSQGSAQTARDWDHHLAQTSEQWDGSQHCSSEGDDCLNMKTLLKVILWMNSL